MRPCLSFHDTSDRRSAHGVAFSQRRERHTSDVLCANAAYHLGRQLRRVLAFATGAIGPPTIHNLFSTGRPSAVDWSVTSVVVAPLKRQFYRRLATDVSEERRERVPSFGKSDVTTAVVGKRWIQRVGTTSASIAPCPIFRSDLPVSGMAVDRGAMPNGCPRTTAATRRGVADAEIPQIKYLRLSAVTSTDHTPTSIPAARFSNERQFSELIAGVDGLQSRHVFERVPR